MRCGRLVRVAVGHDDEHRFDLLVGNEAVHDLRQVPGIGPLFFIAAPSVQQVEHVLDSS